MGEHSGNQVLLHAATSGGTGQALEVLSQPHMSTEQHLGLNGAGWDPWGHYCQSPLPQQEGPQPGRRLGEAHSAECSATGGMGVHGMGHPRSRECPG